MKLRVLHFERRDPAAWTDLPGLGHCGLFRSAHKIITEVDDEGDHLPVEFGQLLR